MFNFDNNDYTLPNLQSFIKEHLLYVNDVLPEDMPGQI